jgi:UDP-N-acetylglucosamine:LPS N-acetylglucosamine transferase
MNKIISIETNSVSSLIKSDIQIIMVKLINFFVLILCLVEDLCIGNQETSNCSDYNFTQIEIEELYHIHGDVLINYRGQLYPKIAYSDQLHEDLFFVLKDPEQAEIIYKAYFQHLLPHLPQELTDSFSRSLLKVCVLFGSSQFSPESALISALKEEGSFIIDWISQRQELFKAFVAEANRPARANCIKNKDTDIYTIVILTTSASGGNQSVACTIESFLSNWNNIRCIVVDSETIAKETDLIMLATGTTTYDGIYEKLFQQNNQGMDVLIKRDVISKQLGKYIPSCFGLKLKELLRSLNPDLILSTRSYTTDDIPLCTLGIPFRMIHCDYELSFFLMDLYGKIEPEMMKFWLPAFEPQVFRPLFVKANKLDIYDEGDNVKELIEKIASITQQSIEIIQKEFELLGYPIRPEFYFISDSEQHEQLRKKWGVKREEIPVLVSMGKNGVGVLEEIFDKLQKSKNRLPIKYIFVCGKNVDLQMRLEHKILKNFLGSESTFKICGLLSAQEMNELMNLCPLYISKPGGAVSSEALETGIHLLIMSSHPWEEANGSRVVRLGIGRRLQENASLTLQIEGYLEEVLHLKRISLQIVSWRELLIDYIKSIKVVFSPTFNGEKCN